MIRERNLKEGWREVTDEIDATERQHSIGNTHRFTAGVIGTNAHTNTRSIQLNYLAIQKSVVV